MQEDNPLPPCFFVVLLVAASPGAIRPVVVSTTHALDNYQIVTVDDIRVLLDYFFLEFKLSKHPGVSSVEIFVRLILLSSGGNYGDTMVYLFYNPASIPHYFCGEVAELPADALNPCVGIYSDLRVFLDSLDESTKKLLDVFAIKIVMYSSGYPTEHVALLDKMNLE